ncbi:TetR/AcrR family transcriptional regulator [Nocardia fluminea]|uniref:TetR/AcrR family transcriptional regulator n=1 Tax=Nocardia fluminea TaxID=134984 RepID=UPI00380B7FF5
MGFGQGEGRVEVDPELPLHVRRDLRRAQLERAAGTVFAVKGYHATRMDDIAGMAGVSKPVLYQHFSSKLELYLVILQGHVDALVTDVRSALGSSVDSQRRVRAAVQAYFDFVDQDVQGYRLVFDSDGAGEPAVQLRVLRAVDDCVSAVCEIVSSGTSLGAYQSRALAIGLVGASQRAAQYWLEEGRPVSKREAVDSMVSLFWGGLSAMPLLRIGEPA